MEAAATIANREARLTAETEKTSFLLQELAHRVKNLLAVVSAIARQTARTVDQSSEFTEQFQARMSGLAATVDLLAKSDWHGVSLENLITRQLEAFGEADRIRMSGPHLLLSPNATEYAGLAVHELATNSVKYGALSGQGHVSIEWAVESDTFRLAWQEAGGPPVASPERCGFGRTVVETIVPQALMGQAELRFGPDGVSWELHAPRGHVIARRSDTR